MKYKLKNIGKVVSGGTPSTKRPEYYAKKGIGWITPKDLSGYHNKYIFHGKRDISKLGLDHSSAKLIPTNSILISSRAPIGYVAIAGNTLATNQGFKSIVPDTSKVLPDYLYYLMLTNKGRLEQVASGSTFKEVSGKTMQELEVDIPSLDKQNRVISKLNPIIEKLESNNRINDNLLELAKTKFRQTYLLPTDEFKKIPNGWHITSFSKIMTFSNGHNFKGNEMLKKYEPLTYKVFKQGNILIGGGLNELGTKSWIKKSKVTKLNKYVLKKWDLLMAMTDMKNKVAILGNTALMNRSNQYILNQRVGLIRSNNYNGLSSAYLFLLTNSKPFLYSIRSRAHSGVQVNLSSKEIRDTDVIIAPKKVNDKFNIFVKPIFERIMANQLENLTLNELKQTLLNRLF